jgi:hypothetical protein
MPLLAAIDPVPFENCREYGSKPASRSNTTEKFPPIGSIPLNGGAYAVKFVRRIRLRGRCRLFNLISEFFGAVRHFIRKIGGYIGSFLRGGLPGLGGQEQASTDH